eukprot:s935_g1.t1
MKEKTEAAKRPARDDRVPAHEWQKITSFKYPGQWAPQVNGIYDDLPDSSLADRKQAPDEPFSMPCWSHLCLDFSMLRSRGPFFLELFAGKAGITEAVQLMGVPVLPPVDVVLSALVHEAVDVLDLKFWDAIMAVIAARLVF